MIEKALSTDVLNLKVKLLSIVGGLRRVNCVNNFFWVPKLQFCCPAHFIVIKIMKGIIGKVEATLIYLVLIKINGVFAGEPLRDMKLHDPSEPNLQRMLLAD